MPKYPLVALEVQGAHAVAYHKDGILYLGALGEFDFYGLYVRGPYAVDIIGTAHEDGDADRKYQRQGYKYYSRKFKFFCSHPISLRYPPDCRERVGGRNFYAFKLVFGVLLYHTVLYPVLCRL